MKNIENISNVNLLTNDMNHSNLEVHDKPNRSRIICYRALQWTWGLPQSMLGAIIYQRYRSCPHTTFHGAAVTVWPHRSSMSLGMFLFMSEELFHGKFREKPVFREGSFARQLLVHEYGHSIQSLIFGPMYLLTVGLPSIVWAHMPALRNYRKNNKKSYYAVYPEKHADKLGERFLREKAVGNVFLEF